MQAINIETEQYTIRRIGWDDLEQLAKLYSHYTLNTICTYYHKEVDASYMDGLLRGMGHVCFVAETENRVVGYVHLIPMFSFVGKKFEMAVYLLPDFTGRGLGKRLVRYAEAVAQRLGTKLLCVSVCTENEPSLQLFTSLGYTKTRVKKNCAKKFDRMLSTQLFEKELN